MERLLSTALALWVSLFFVSCGVEDPDSDLDFWWKKYTVDTSVKISSFDKIVLSADLYLPKPYYFPGERPVILFANSWTLNEKEYIGQAREFAKKGYIVLSYTTRGFGRSGGQVSAAGPDDVKDVSAAIDWLLDNTPADVDRIGMAGLSYGAGIGLLALGLEPRLFTTAALSGWSDLGKSLFGAETVRKIWIDLLIASGELAGRIDPEFRKMYQNLNDYVDIPVALAWASSRSALTHVDAINHAGKPVFLANSYRDNLFPPNQSLDFFSKLTTPRKMILSPGIHASAEVPGLFGLKNSVWNDVHAWFDHWLIDSQGKKRMDDQEVVFNYDGERDSYTEFFPKNEQSVDLTPHRMNRGLDGVSKYTIRSYKDSGATTGIPILSSVLDSHTNIKVKKWLPLVDRRYGMVYYSEPIREDKMLRGVPTIDLTVEAHHKGIQLVAYVYSVNKWDVGTLLSHGVFTKRDMELDGKYQIEIEGSTFAFNMKEGDRIALVIDTHDPLYGRPHSEEFSLSIIHGGDDSARLYLPEVD